MNILEWIVFSPLLVIIVIIDFFRWLFTRRGAIICPRCKSWWRTSGGTFDDGIWYCGRCKKAWVEKRQQVV